MRGFVFFLFLFCFPFKKVGQDKIILTNGDTIHGKVTEISPDKIKYNQSQSKPRSAVAIIIYSNSTRDTLNDPLGYGSNNPYHVNKNLYRIYLTDIFNRKLSFGYERILSRKLSLEVDGFYKFKGSVLVSPAKLLKSINKASEGAEIRMGVSRHFYTSNCRNSVGLSFSYRQQSFSHLFIDLTYNHPYNDKGLYVLSQKKTGVGAFIKYNLLFNSRNPGFEFFVITGLYATNTRTQYNWYKETYGAGPGTYDASQIPPLQNILFKDGHGFYPFFNIGMDYKILQPAKGWYNERKIRIDSCKFTRKNILLYNPIELTDGAIGMTYIRVVYRHCVSLINSGSIGTKGTSSNLSNGILTEQNLNYGLNHKNFDFSFSPAYNFSLPQQTYFFAGPQVRMAQFEGWCYNQSFLLNKYYLFLNSGLIARNKMGMSLLINVSIGHYYNVYLSKPVVFEVPYSTINSFNFSFQFGYSF